MIINPKGDKVTKKKKTPKVMRAHSMLKASKRQRMVASRVFEILSMTLLKDITDPSLEGVSITHVDVSGDLQIARIFFATASRDADLSQILEGFRRAEGFFRRTLSQAMATKKTPELRFYADENIYASWNIDKILDSDYQSAEDVSDLDKEDK